MNSALARSIADLSSRWRNRFLPWKKSSKSGHLRRGARGEKTILSPATFKRLHTKAPPGQSTPSFDLAEVDWSKGTVLWHSGSNGTFFALVHIVPAENYATCVACNCGDDGSGEACQRSVQNPCKMPDRIMTTKVVAIDSDRNMDFDSCEVPAALAGGRLEVLVLGIRRAVDIAACTVDDDPEHPHAKRGEPLIAGVHLG